MTDYILKMENITKTYPGVKALNNVNFQVERGTIHALVGENGAGKSTLMKVLSGIIPYGDYTGSIVYNGKECCFKNIHDSEKLGIVIIHQELALIPELTIAENMFLGNERADKVGVIDWTKTHKQATDNLKKVGLKESSYTLIKDIGTGKQQLVEIAKALSKNVKLLILDEPTSSLNEADSKMLLDMLIGFKKEGMTSIIITHKLNEVAYCADNITVLRDGATIETIDNTNHTVDEERIIKGMVGRELTDRYPKRERKEPGEVVFEVKDWNVYHPIYDDKKVVNNVSFKVRRGEVVGFSGLQGAGRTELMMSLFGKSYGTNIFGEEYIKGEKVKLKSPKDAISHGLAYVTEDRKNNGLILSDTISWNTVMAKIRKIADKFGIVVDTNKQDEAAEYYVKRMKTRTPSIYQNTGNLSGGNQQKVLLGKWMFTEPEIFILDEPTRGIDVGAKYEIYTIINEMVEEGKAVIMVSSELPELLGMCDRIYVMNEGNMVTEFDAKEATQEKIMAAILASDSKID